MTNGMLNTLLDACGVKDKRKWCVVNLDKRIYELGEPENVWEVVTTLGRKYRVCARSKGQCARMMIQADIFEGTEYISTAEIVDKVDFLPLDENNKPIRIVGIE